MIAENGTRGINRSDKIASQPRSAEHIFKDYLEGQATAAMSVSAGREELSEHLALIARWSYSNPRDGEIFFREKDWPYRKILRACSRLLAPPTSEPAASGHPRSP